MIIRKHSHSNFCCVSTRVRIAAILRSLVQPIAGSADRWYKGYLTSDFTLHIEAYLDRLESYRTFPILGSSVKEVACKWQVYQTINAQREREGRSDAMHSSNAPIRGRRALVISVASNPKLNIYTPRTYVYDFSM